jgi:hypothetical protein
VNTHVSSAFLSRYLPRGVSRADMHDEDREKRVEQRLGRRLTSAEAFRLRNARNLPMPLESRAYYYARGFRLAVTGSHGCRWLVMAKNGRSYLGNKIGGAS